MTSDTLLENQSILIQKGKITEIGKYQNLSKSKQTKVIDGKGKYLMPGLADMHVHLPTEDKIEKLLLSNIAAGVTQIRIMNSQVSQIEVREKLKNNSQLITPNIHYSHLITRNENYTESQADSLMQQLRKHKINIVKLVSLSNEETFDNLAKAANEYNILFCGHYPMFQRNGKLVLVDMGKTLKSNFKSIEHLAGYISLQDKDEVEKAIQLTKEYNIYNCPTLDFDIMAYNLQYPDEYRNRLTYPLMPRQIIDNWESNYAAAIEKAGGREKVIESRDKYTATFDLKLSVLKKLYENDCLLLIGGDAGNNFQADGFNVHEEMMNWSRAGIDNYTILKSATVTPSLFFNDPSGGTIEVGKNADLIILEKNPLKDIRNITTIQMTIAGEKIHNNQALMSQM